MYGLQADKGIWMARRNANHYIAICDKGLPLDLVLHKDKKWILAMKQSITWTDFKTSTNIKIVKKQFDVGLSSRDLSTSILYIAN